MQQSAVKFALFGHPVGHSLSAKMHTASFNALGFDASYEGVDVPPENLADDLKRFVDEGYRGLNLTIPHKRNVLPLLTRLDVSVNRYGAANTVVIEKDGSTIGYNTDVFGFLRDLEERGVSLAARKVLMLGAGGAAMALARGCLDAGCADLLIANRTPRDGTIALASPECLTLANMADVIINATPVGLKADDESVLPPSVFRKGQVVYDCCPTAHDPATVIAARDAGATAFSGLGFLVHQGAKAFELWTGRKADVEAMKKAVGYR